MIFHLFPRAAQQEYCMNPSLIILCITSCQQLSSCIDNKSHDSFSGAAIVLGIPFNQEIFVLTAKNFLEKEEQIDKMKQQIKPSSSCYDRLIDVDGKRLFMARYCWRVVYWCANLWDDYVSWKDSIY